MPFFNTRTGARRARSHRCGDAGAQPVRRGVRFARAAASSAIAAVAVGAVSVSASAGFDPIPINPGLPPVEVPLCQRWDAPTFCFADYEAHASGYLLWDTVRNGQRASFFYVTIRNTGLVNPGPVWSSVGIDQYEIIEVETVWGNRGVEAAPVAEADDDATWTIHHIDGLDKGEFTTFRVWVGSWDAVDLIVTANHHAGVESFGAPAPAGYRAPERNRSNNVAQAFG